MTRYEMILTLINAYDPVIRGEDLSVIGNQIMTWQLRVENSLEAAGMQVALKIWRDARKGSQYAKIPNNCILLSIGVRILLNLVICSQQEANCDV